MKPLFNALGAAALLVVAHSAVAQEGPATQEDISKLPRAEALDRYMDWIDLANKISRCCSTQDMNIALKQRPTGDPDYPLEFEFNRTVNGKWALSHPVWIRFPKENIKTKEDKEILAVCRERKKADTAQGKTNTCDQPPGASVHGLDNTVEDDEGNLYIRGNNKVVYKPGSVIDADLWDMPEGTRYCAHPDQKAFGF
jgi:hypothetical protein